MNAASSQLAFAARIAALYRFSSVTTALTLAMAPIVVWRALPHASMTGLMAWWAGVSGVSLLRLWMLRRHRSLGAEADASRWARRGTMAAILVGLSWGALALPGVSAAPSAMPAVVCLLVAIAAIGLYSYSPHWPAYLGMVVPIACCAMLGVVLTGLPMAPEFALIVLALVTVLAIASRRISRLFEDMTLARFEAQRLIGAAEAGNRAKSLFLANMSHELRTPLNAVMGFGQLLRGAALGAEERAHVQGLLSASSTLLNVVDEVLDFATLDAGELVLEPQPTAVRGLVAELDAVFRPMAEAKGLGLVVSVDPALPGGVLIDPRRVRQVLGILLRNAVKFTAHGQVELRVQRAQAADGSARLRVEVSDTGVGIAPDVQAQVFEAFWQADISSTRRYGGVGLGLAIARRIVRRHGGELGFTTRPGAGSCFTLELPLEATQVAPPTPAPEVASDVPLHGRVLLAEDDAVNRQLTSLILQRMGLQVETAADGIEAVRAFERAPPDVVLMDCQMPNLDGYAAARAIRALPQDAARVPIIALTAHALSADREACFAAGMDAHLSKPVAIPALRACLASWLPRVPAPRADA